MPKLFSCYQQIRNNSRHLHFYFDDNSNFSVEDLKKVVLNQSSGFSSNVLHHVRQKLLVLRGDERLSTKNDLP